VYRLGFAFGYSFLVVLLLSFAVLSSHSLSRWHILYASCGLGFRSFSRLLRRGKACITYRLP